MTAQDWAAALDDLEQQLTGHRALLTPAPDVTASAAAWAPPHHLGPVPEDCLSRARVLLRQLEDVAGQLDRARVRTRRDLRLQRALPSRAQGEAVYVDVRG